MTKVLVRMTPQKAVLSELRSHPHRGHQLQGCSDNIKILLLVFNYQSGYRYSMGICRSITKSIHPSEQHKHEGKMSIPLINRLGA